MNREIKFRAWDKKRKRLYKVLHWHCPTMGDGHWATVEGFDIIEQKEINLYIQPKDIILMQYTGLQDKNGKEIYEGDLFKPDTLTKPYCLEVKFNEKTACFEPFGNSEYSDVPSLGKVIGNIHQNPEHLKGGE